jgi:hypothetical protein
VANSLPLLTTALADRYVIERELGRGGMATVYLARDLKHHRAVAVKVLRPESGGLVYGTRSGRRRISPATPMSKPPVPTPAQNAVRAIPSEPRLGGPHAGADMAGAFSARCRAESRAGSRDVRRTPHRDRASGRRSSTPFPAPRGGAPGAGAVPPARPGPAPRAQANRPPA